MKRHRRRVIKKKGPSPAKQRTLARKAFRRQFGTKTALDKADALFSREIRDRDGKCLFPGCTVVEFDRLQCSHYVSRSVSATRFDHENCIALCWNHHYFDKMLGWEYQKQREDEHGWDGRYTLFMRSWLGPERFAALLERGKTSMKRIDAVHTYLSKTL